MFYRTTYWTWTARYQVFSQKCRLAGYICPVIFEDINSYEEIIKSYNGLELETEKAGTAQKNCNEKQELLNKLKKKKEA